MENEKTWIKELKEKRLVYGVFQNRLVVVSHITRPYLPDIGAGKAVSTQQVRGGLLNVLKRFNPDNPLEMLFDYVRTRLPTNDTSQTIGEVLCLSMDCMLHEDFSYYFCPEHYRFGDIVVLISHDVNKGVLLELRGKGCRQSESFLLTQHRSWYGFS